MKLSVNYSLFILAFITLQACNPSIKNPSILQTKTSDTANAKIFITALNTDFRLTKTKEDIQLKPFGQPLETKAFVLVDPKKQFQIMVGIGGALTDAAAETFFKLPSAVQQEFLTAYFDEEKGIGYNFSRTNIASCDFSSASYDYVENDDSLLTSFNIGHDEKFRIPFIKKAIVAANSDLLIFASPWSPPAWMKSNDNRLKGGKLLDKYKQAWANYYVRFVEEYEKRGIPVWGLSVQNEPMAIQRWESCVYTAEEERDFIKKYLGPTLHKSGMGEKKLIAWDHNRDQIYQRATTILNDPEAAKYVWGIGFHWYETWFGGGMQFNNLKLVNEAFPDKKLIFTEGCVEHFNLDMIDDWTLGEKYGYSMLNDFNNGTVAWTDWNILLDETGGPNHVGNFCFAPIHGDTHSGNLIYTNSYYYIGHFSKFIERGARRIASSSSRSDLQNTAFINPNGSIVVVVLNCTEKPFRYKLIIGENGTDLKSLPRSIMTIVL